MAATRRSENIRAGLFVLGAILLAFFIILTLAGVKERFRPANEFIVRYSLSEGATGLQEGSDVRVGGRKVGIVSRVDLHGDDETRPTHVDVFIRVNRNITFFSDTTAFLERPLLGSNSVINFLYLGGEEGSSELASGDIIEGALAAPSVLASAGYGSEQAQQLQTIFARAEDIVARLDRITISVEDETLPAVNTSVSDLQVITADARERSAGWFDQVDVILADVVEASDTAKTSVEDIRTMIADVDQIIEDNREGVNTIVANAEEASTQVNDILRQIDEETVVALNALLEDGRAGVADARGTLADVDSLFKEQTPEIRRTMANARLASDQLRLTLGEVRRSPWRLLYRPDQKELEFELLYDATRSYASAVSDLRAASESLQAVSTSGRSETADGESIESLLTGMAEAFSKYETAEQRFLQLLGANQP